MSLLRIGARSLSSGRSATAAQAAIADKTPGNAEVFTCKNGVKVLNIDVPSPCISFLFKVDGVGPVSEGYDNAGVAQGLRLASGYSTKHFTSFGLTRSVQQIGSSIKCWQSRTATYYAMDLNRDNYNDVDYLVDVVCNPAFKPWEVQDCLAKAMKIEIEERYCSMTACVEGLHKAVYKSGLGNSLFCPDRNVGRITSKMLEAFHSQHYNTGNLTVGVLGLDRRHVESIFESIDMKQGSATSAPKSTYSPGEFRLENSAPNTHVIVGTQFLPSDAKKNMARYLLSLILGQEPAIKRGRGCGKLQAAVSDALGSATYGTSSVLLDHGTTGLLGAVLITDPASVSKGVDAVVSTLKSTRITDMDLKLAKAKAYLTSELLHSRRNTILECHLTLPAYIGDSSELNSVSVSDVQAASDELAKAKLYISSVGNISGVPFIESL